MKGNRALAFDDPAKEDLLLGTHKYKFSFEDYEFWNIFFIFL